ncbi:hypothetical protein BU24DRAFT_362141 [Aaosphaeria arxii CBS 175.79]|uniref:Zn(2)-C6 fungal-type domain-containing protein n=1 Tax=Aaosphaeria arxii CBS 175.79 TaxID=1450172 RepID=A0A6A5Y9S5_9PLEO|nr:uncharacterized protein BU24DRAFT_362141 [Aaosphaeria arxii CBS 175.79]KAF2021511.1 hypothetical protein BU24DRAFT_362141 [Aaosphaeria arxii CBS 175.79]
MQQPGQKENRATPSCTECQRRKQKCSREWPCNHCQARKVPHLCQFGQKKIEQKQSSAQADVRGQKRDFKEDHDEQDSVVENGPDDVENGLKAWGYMPGHVHYALASNDEEDKQNSPASSESDHANSAVELVLHAIPPRSITDTFVNHFLTVVNYRYNAIYGPTFTENYVQWWTDRASGKKLSPEFTCLLLRILAYSVQYLTVEIRRMVEFELACSSQQLTERFGGAADQLSSTFPPSKSSLERVQEQFLRGAWLKSESKIVESWHALGSTIREAQELGMDKDLGIENLSEFEIEIRRRIWTLLYIWDWQMGAWLGRPNQINQKDCKFVFPNLRLDESASTPNLLSAFAHMSLQAMLGRRIADYLNEHPVGQPLSADQVFMIQGECELFTAELPPVFRIQDPDLSLDETHPYYVFQRSQLHVVIYTVQLDFLKPYLTRSHEDELTSHDDEFRSMGVELGLKLLRKARILFDHEFPINAKFHLVVFSIFDTATLMCSAIIHDVRKTLPHRERVMDEIENGLGMLHQLSSTSKIGASSYNFLLKLVQASPVLSRHSRIGKRQRLGATSSSVENSSFDEAKPTIISASPSVNKSDNIEPHPQHSFTDDLNFDLDQFLQQNPFGTDASADMGGLEQIWDWEALHLEGLNNGEPALSQASQA